MEEPESHLFPDAQKDMAEALGLFANKNNQLMVTTHSPYILGAFNNLLYSGKSATHGIISSALLKWQEKGRKVGSVRCNVCKRSPMKENI